MRRFSETLQERAFAAHFVTPPGRPAKPPLSTPTPMIPQVASPAFGAAPVFSLKVHRIGTGLTEEDLFVGYTPYSHG